VQALEEEKANLHRENMDFSKKTLNTQIEHEKTEANELTHKAKIQSLETEIAGLKKELQVAN